MDQSTLSSVQTVESAQLETYVTPAVVYEAELEVRAGTTFSSSPDPLNLFGSE